MQGAAAPFHAMSNAVGKAGGKGAKGSNGGGGKGGRGNGKGSNQGKGSGWGAAEAAWKKAVGKTAEDQSVGQSGAVARRHWICGGPGGCGHATNLVGVAACASCGLPWSYWERPQFWSELEARTKKRSPKGDDGKGKSAVGAPKPKGAAAASVADGACRNAPWKSPPEGVLGGPGGGGGKKGPSDVVPAKPGKSEEPWVEVLRRSRQAAAAEKSKASDGPAGSGGPAPSGDKPAPQAAGGVPGQLARALGRCQEDGGDPTDMEDGYATATEAGEANVEGKDKVAAGGPRQSPKCVPKELQAKAIQGGLQALEYLKATGAGWS